MKKNKYLIASIFTMAIVVLAVVCGGYFIYAFSGERTFAKGTYINGVGVGGLTLADAQEKIHAKIDSLANNVCLTLNYDNQEWVFGGANFSVNSDVDELAQKVLLRKAPGNYFQDNNGLNIEYVFNGMENKLEEVFADIEREPQDAKIIFNPSQENPFEITPHIIGIAVDKDRLCSDILQKLKNNNVVFVDIPVIETEPNVTTDSLAKYIRKQGYFETDYEKSTEQRKSNIRLALQKINGTKLESGEEFSFNNIVGERTAENGFKEAKVILGGEYENGVGGGICQASTTLYNAAVRAGLDITEVNPHSLPASYVPLSLDAMVSWGYSDLKFVNNSDGPVYIQTKADDKKVSVTIYGNTLLDGQKIVPKSELIKKIPHMGDKVVQDTNGEYKDKIMFKGEYIRVSYPKEGYESKAYLDFYENGVVVSSKEIRHDVYNAKQGVVYEGVETLPEGMSLPANTVSIIVPQELDN